MEILKYCSAALLVSFLLLVIRQWKSDTVLLVRLAATLLFGYAALSAAAPLVGAFVPGNTTAAFDLASWMAVM